FNIQNGLVVGYFIGWLFTFIFGIIQLLRSEFDWNFFSFSIIRESIIKYKHYPIYNTIPSFLNVLAQSSPFLLITYYYGNEYGGYFNICKQIIQIPFSFVSMSISQVYFKKLVDSINNHQRIFPLLIHVSKFLFFLIGIAMFVIFIGGEKLFGLIFGKNWEYVGVLSKYYIFSVIMFSIHQSFSIIYPSLHLVKQESIIKFLYFIIVFFVLYFHPSNFLTFMLIYTIAECVVFIIGICVILIHVHKYEKSIS
ncbi:MAG: oligosaccharide flippase family protein, partial [Bacteroidia bacterium]|nr:oligosaccharide flippase family protein [Bacteroidia bacterium]